MKNQFSYVSLMTWIVFRTRIEIKNLLPWKPNLTFASILIPLCKLSWFISILILRFLNWNGKPEWGLESQLIQISIKIIGSVGGEWRSSCLRNQFQFFQIAIWCPGKAWGVEKPNRGGRNPKSPPPSLRSPFSGLLWIISFSYYYTKTNPEKGDTFEWDIHCKCTYSLLHDGGVDCRALGWHQNNFS